MLLSLYLSWNILHVGVRWEHLLSCGDLESCIKFIEGKICENYSKNNHEIYYV